VMTPNTILIADDQKSNRGVLKSILNRPEYHMVEACNGREALDILGSQKIDLVILDLMMPEVSGFEVLEQMQSDSAMKHIPVIVLSALEDSDSIARALSMGAHDVLSKNIDDFDRRFKIPLKVKNLLAIKNVNDLLEANLRQAEKLSILDEVTDLFNYRYFKERLFEEFARSLRYTRAMSLIVFDLDNLKKVNDTYGHPTGTALLKEVGELVLQSCRSVDIPVRYGGDEFCIITPEIDMKQALVPAERLRVEISRLGEKLNLDDISVSASFGVASFRGEKEFADDQALLKAADDGCYKSKEAGKNCIHCFYDGICIPSSEYR
jgi:diguanylate cyclase (GGDEF)-like protein